MGNYLGYDEKHATLLSVNLRDSVISRFEDETRIPNILSVALPVTKHINPTRNFKLEKKGHS